MCKYTTIYTMVDDFCKTYEEWLRYKLLSSNRSRIRGGKLSLSESVTMSHDLLPL